MKCKKCKKGELLHLINTTKDTDDIIGIKKTGIVYICNNCEKLTLIKCDAYSEDRE